MQGGGGGDANKRARSAPVQPPPQEQLPTREGMTLDAITTRFNELVQEVGDTYAYIIAVWLLYAWKQYCAVHMLVGRFERKGAKAAQACSSCILHKSKHFSCLCCTRSMRRPVTR